MGSTIRDGTAQMAAANQEAGATSLLGRAIGTLSALEERLIERINQTISNVLSRYGRFLHVRIGRIQVQPLKVGPVTWKFDMTHTDERGYPLSGSVTFSGLEGIELAHQGTVRSTINLRNM
jgi:hypothetical protein